MYHTDDECGTLWTRRSWLKAAGALTVGATCAPTLRAAAETENPSTPLMQIGILMGTFARPMLETRLDAMKDCGLDCVQLNMGCAGLPPMPDEIPPGLVTRIRRAADARGITIASLEGTFNMSHPDADHRRAGLRRLRVMAAVCQPLGTSKIHLCTGTRDPGNMWRRHADNNSPEAWRDMVSCVREATDIARQAGVILAFVLQPGARSHATSCERVGKIGGGHGVTDVRPKNCGCGFAMYLSTVRRTIIASFVRK